MKYLEEYKIFESKSKRKIGWFVKHCVDIGYSGAKNGRCCGKREKKRKVFQGYKLPLTFDKDYYYDKKPINESKKYTINYIPNDDIFKYHGREEFTDREYKIFDDLIKDDIINRTDFNGSTGVIGLRLNMKQGFPIDLIEVLKYGDEYYVLPYFLGLGVGKSIVIDGFDSFAKLKQILLDHKHMM